MTQVYRPNKNEVITLTRINNRVSRETELEPDHTVIEDEPKRVDSCWITPTSSSDKENFSLHNSETQRKRPRVWVGVTLSKYDDSSLKHSSTLDQ